MEFFWENSGWESEDKHLIGMQSMPFQRQFPELKLMPGLYSIRGPRQIGKSSWVKSLLSKVCRANSATKAFYLSCENIENYKELAEILNLYKKTRDYIFLDEVTFIKDWARPIKKILDEGYKGVILVTGSNLYDLRKGVDRMPGREGAGRDLLLLPMNFFEFSKARVDAGFSTNDREKELLAYFRIGGFPIAVAEAKSGTKTKKSERIIEKWILGDIAKTPKNETYAKEILSQIGLTLTSTMSTQKLATRTQLGSHHTVADYLNLLEDMFLVRTLYSIDPNSGAYRLKKEKKYYLTDPLYLKVALNWLALPENEVSDSSIAEMVAHEFLRQHEERMGFLISEKGGEVDFYAHKRWAIEVKWSERIPKLSKAYHDLSLLNKRVWIKDNFLVDLPM